MRHDNKGASFNANITTKSDDKDSDPNTIKETRKLAVGKFTSQYQSKQDHHLFEPRQLPFIRLKGEWLESLGFQVGDILTLEGSHQRIVLTVDEQQSGPAKRKKPSGGESL
ncbi:SymE family type I addiction module toxin [Pleionea sp. CnH1-48]|uniref:SymE family type I addiction module toxin n=1 Tax=Pleionea sp. CnH1-48 TaxID=2954494 RepID=UPI002097342D|nr:SymE family type I addiction module toxin [Pleionea sp. CnH1-48]MCO7223031.1 type I toxin-antitoxin system SymE family toxin [Pleionea sp. CnH1-48]